MGNNNYEFSEALNFCVYNIFFVKFYILYYFYSFSFFLFLSLSIHYIVLEVSSTNIVMYRIVCHLFLLKYEIFSLLFEHYTYFPFNFFVCIFNQPKYCLCVDLRWNQNAKKKIFYISVYRIEIPSKNNKKKHILLKRQKSHKHNINQPKGNSSYLRLHNYFYIRNTVRVHNLELWRYKKHKMYIFFSTFSVNQPCRVQLLRIQFLPCLKKQKKNNIFPIVLIRFTRYMKYETYL